MWSLTNRFGSTFVGLHVNNHKDLTHKYQHAHSWVYNQPSGSSQSHAVYLELDWLVLRDLSLEMHVNRLSTAILSAIAVKEIRRQWIWRFPRYYDQILLVHYGWFNRVLTQPHTTGYHHIDVNEDNTIPSSDRHAFPQSRTHTSFLRATEVWVGETSNNPTSQDNSCRVIHLAYTLYSDACVFIQIFILFVIFQNKIELGKDWVITTELTRTSLANGP